MKKYSMLASLVLCLCWTSCNRPEAIRPENENPQNAGRFPIPSSYTCTITTYTTETADVRFEYTGLSVWGALSKVFVNGTQYIISTSSSGSFTTIASHTHYYFLRRDAGGHITEGWSYAISGGVYEPVGRIRCTYNANHQLVEYHHTSSRRPEYSLFEYNDGNLVRAYKGRDGSPFHLYLVLEGTEYDTRNTPWSQSLTQWLAATGLLGFYDLTAYSKTNMIMHNFYYEPGRWFAGTFPVTYESRYSADGRPLSRKFFYPSGAATTATFSYACAF